MKEEEIEKGDCRPPTRKVFFFVVLSDLNQAVPNHLADESQTRQPDTPPDHPGTVSERSPVRIPAGLLVTFSFW